MKKIIFFVFISFNVFALPGDEKLTGDKRTACEVILCLSSSERPSECNPPIAKYFSIKAYSHGSYSPSKTIQKRKEFLKLCPASSADNKMESLVVAMSKQEILCKADELNKIVDRKFSSCGRDCTPDVYYRTSPSLPEYCSVLYNHEYTNLQLPQYTCDKKFYLEKDWRRGYTVKYDYINREIRTPIKKACWVD
ncbi:conjugal transfer protein TrbM [Gilliamella sp. B2894]|uniref:TrbM/KikA/MpfK family conjugal transfer protein n=1 Tax=Gilliamella sp. B2894 TaxID=2817978 RepID=UPI00226A11DB|nr:TrbM/KikA/MpfK family conjugal transfer protein [Gilliamella sp. B2894]MCX8657365.1 conjugal transfer protein TrbM [Gilliamella sp. B2894]